MNLYKNVKKLISVTLIVLIAFGISACGNKSTNVFKSDVKEKKVESFSVSEQLPMMSLDADKYGEFVNYLDYDNVECPYSDIFGIENALAEKEKRVFDVQNHSYDFLEGETTVDAEKLYATVKENNALYMNGEGMHFSEELSDSELRKCCGFVADAVNWGIENNPDIDMAELSCVLGNLKIVNKNSMNYGVFNDKNAVLAITVEMIKNAEKKEENMYEHTVVHEAMHLLQSRCTDIEQGDNDVLIGTSYSFENLDINPLKNRWLFEASAEVNTAIMYGEFPVTYPYMIDALETISYATVLNDGVKARQLEKMCFTQNANGVYEQLGFADKSDAIKFLYVVELLREKPDDFKTVYESKFGTIEGEYGEFIKDTFYPYYVEVLSKLLYKNIAFKLTQNEISLNDVFYIISVYEMCLLKDVPLDNSTVRERFTSVYEQYADLQKTFFELLQDGTDLNVFELFKNYDANYGDNSISANASLDWLDAEKKDYVLYVNNYMYDKSYTQICE